MEAHARAPDPLTKSGDMASNWHSWKEDFIIFLKVTGYIDKPNEIRANLLKNRIGKVGIDAIQQISFDNPQDKDDMDILIAKLENFFNPPKIEMIERYEFFTRSKKQNESMEQYINILREKAKTCNFKEITDSIIRDKIILDTNDKILRKKFLETSNLDLDKIVVIYNDYMINIEKMKEVTKENKTEAKSFTQKEKMKEVSKENKTEAKSFTQKAMPNNAKKGCWRCGQQHAQGKCPANGSKCTKCNEINHFTHCCRGFKTKANNDKMNKNLLNPMEQKTKIISKSNDKLWNNETNSKVTAMDPIIKTTSLPDIPKSCDYESSSSSDDNISFRPFLAESYNPSLFSYCHNKIVNQPEHVSKKSKFNSRKKSDKLKTTYVASTSKQKENNFKSVSDVELVDACKMSRTSDYNKTTKQPINVLKVSQCNNSNTNTTTIATTTYVASTSKQAENNFKTVFNFGLDAYDTNRTSDYNKTIKQPINIPKVSQCNNSNINSNTITTITKVANTSKQAKDNFKSIPAPRLVDAYEKTSRTSHYNKTFKQPINIPKISQCNNSNTNSTTTATTYVTSNSKQAENNFNTVSDVKLDACETSRASNYNKTKQLINIPKVSQYNNSNTNSITTTTATLAAISKQAKDTFKSFPDIGLVDAYEKTSRTSHYNKTFKQPINVPKVSQCNNSNTNSTTTATTYITSNSKQAGNNFNTVSNVGLVEACETNRTSDHNKTTKQPINVPKVSQCNNSNTNATTTATTTYVASTSKQADDNFKTVSFFGLIDAYDTNRISPKTIEQPKNVSNVSLCINSSADLTKTELGDNFIVTSASNKSNALSNITHSTQQLFEDGEKSNKNKKNIKKVKSVKNSCILS